MCSDAEDFPDPIVIVIGESGTGKSTFSNFISGQSEKQPCAFLTGNNADLSSVTKHPEARIVRWRGTGELFTLVDTPGLSDPQGEDADRNHFKEVVGVLRNKLKHIHAIVHVVKGTENRKSESLLKNLQIFNYMFGDAVKNNLITEVTFWDHFNEDIEDRKKFEVQNNNYAKSLFRNTSASFPIVFIDPMDVEGEQRKVLYDKFPEYRQTNANQIELLRKFVWQKLKEPPFSCSEKCEFVEDLFTTRSPYPRIKVGDRFGSERSLLTELTLVCNIASFDKVDPLHVTWWLNGTKIIPEDSQISNSHDNFVHKQTIYIEQLGMEDAGTYACKYNNLDPQNSLKITVKDFSPEASFGKIGKVLICLQSLPPQNFKQAKKFRPVWYRMEGTHPILLPVDKHGSLGFKLEEMKCNSQLCSTKVMANLTLATFANQHFFCKSPLGRSEILQSNVSVPPTWSEWSSVSACPMKSRTMRCAAESKKEECKEPAWTNVNQIFDCINKSREGYCNEAVVRESQNCSVGERPTDLLPLEAKYCHEDRVDSNQGYNRLSPFRAPSGPDDLETFIKTPLPHFQDCEYMLVIRTAVDLQKVAKNSYRCLGKGGGNLKIITNTLVISDQNISFHGLKSFILLADDIIVTVPPQKERAKVSFEQPNSLDVSVGQHPPKAGENGTIAHIKVDRVRSAVPLTFISRGGEGSAGKNGYNGEQGQRGENGHENRCAKCYDETAYHNGDCWEAIHSFAVWGSGAQVACAKPKSVGCNYQGQPATNGFNGKEGGAGGKGGNGGHGGNSGFVRFDARLVEGEIFTSKCSGKGGPGGRGGVGGPGGQGGVGGKGMNGTCYDCTGTGRQLACSLSSYFLLAACVPTICYGISQGLDGANGPAGKNGSEGRRGSQGKFDILHESLIDGTDEMILKALEDRRNLFNNPIPQNDVDFLPPDIGEERLDAYFEALKRSVEASGEKISQEELKENIASLAEASKGQSDLEIKEFQKKHDDLGEDVKNTQVLISDLTYRLTPALEKAIVSLKIEKQGGKDSSVVGIVKNLVSCIVGFGTGNIAKGVEKLSNVIESVSNIALNGVSKNLDIGCDGQIFEKMRETRDNLQNKSDDENNHLLEFFSLQSKRQMKLTLSCVLQTDSSFQSKRNEASLRLEYLIDDIYEAIGTSLKIKRDMKDIKDAIKSLSDAREVWEGTEGNIRPAQSNMVYWKKMNIIQANFMTSELRIAELLNTMRLAHEFHYLDRFKDLESGIIEATSYDGSITNGNLDAAERKWIKLKDNFKKWIQDRQSGYSNQREDGKVQILITCQDVLERISNGARKIAAFSIDINGAITLEDNQSQFENCAQFLPKEASTVYSARVLKMGARIDFSPNSRTPEEIEIRDQ